MQYFPLFLDLTNKPVLVVGGGEVASRKVDALLRANASVTVVSPVLSNYLKQCAESNQLKWIESHYRDDYIKNPVQVWATTSDANLNHQVHNDAKKRNILVNVVDDKPYCDFITPSMINRGKVQIAISSGGASPVLVRNIREKIERVLAQNTGLLAEFTGEKRDHIKSIYHSVDDRRRFWERFFARPNVELSDNKEKLEVEYQSCLSVDAKVTASRIWMEFNNDVENISIKTLRMMQQAEWVIYPQDCPFDFVDLCRRDAERIVYRDVAHLTAILNLDADSMPPNICIFIPKDAIESDQELKGLVLSDRILRIVG
ncbi:precorrin-2 dehydrogenase/sirohydrochlorin ferrochelatase family protein [Vibrio algarum]|uniref:precorrin-2 dehydrogenase n=1 Tax=Vibrio algarum TaxID=3020714 RepID=A0ABT4YRT4_9VIBR|nr:NAD(P)-dependent oxidoreductase [Vibrio sp. KJ40-1]MDB1123921.1 NAD(P)-dependent oxidoreductase [Vibrio sp. KJ40-1]